MAVNIKWPTGGNTKTCGSSLETLSHGGRGLTLDTFSQVRPAFQSSLYDVGFWLSCGPLKE